MAAAVALICCCVPVSCAAWAGVIPASPADGRAGVAIMLGITTSGEVTFGMGADAVAGTIGAVLAAGETLDCAGGGVGLGGTSGENVAVSPKRASRVSIRCSSAACLVADNVSGAWAAGAAGACARVAVEAGAELPGAVVAGAVAVAGEAVVTIFVTTAWSAVFCCCSMVACC